MVLTSFIMENYKEKKKVIGHLIRVGRKKLSEKPDPQLLKDYSSIDISPDVQVRKFFIKNGLLREGASNEELIYLAREIYPAYPGLSDFPAWEGGKNL